MNETGGPAFPYHGPDAKNAGMTLRDYFAAKAMEGILACDIDCSPKYVPVIASSAYVMADAMLKARHAG